MLIETQKLAPLVAIFVVGLVSFPGESTQPLASSSTGGGASGRKAFAPPSIAKGLRDPFERRAPVGTGAVAVASGQRPWPKQVSPPSLPRMSGVILGPGARVVLFGRTVVAEGESIGGAVVTRVDRKQVELRFSGRRWTLGLGEDVPRAILETSRPAAPQPVPRTRLPARGAL